MIAMSIMLMLRLRLRLQLKLWLRPRKVDCVLAARHWVGLGLASGCVNLGTIARWQIISPQFLCRPLSRLIRHTPVGSAWNELNCFQQ